MPDLKTEFPPSEKLGSPCGSSEHGKNRMYITNKNSFVASLTYSAYLSH